MAPAVSSVVLAAVGSSLLVLGFILLSIWLYRKRHFKQLDAEAAAVNKLQHYEFDHKDIRLLKTLQQPQDVHLPPMSIRTSFVLPNSTPIRGGPRTAYQSGAVLTYYPDTSPPARSSVWRGKQWVTVTRPKINAPPPPKNRQNKLLATQSVIGEREKKSRVERLSQLISKMKIDFKDIEL
jgi:hypothetical protein